MSARCAVQVASTLDVLALCARPLALNRRASSHGLDELPLQLASHLHRH